MTEAANQSHAVLLRTANEPVAAENAARPEMDAISVLVVDDQRLIRDMLSSGLEHHLPQCHVDTASSLAGAVEHLERRPRTDIVLLDYKMADMRGVRSVELVKKLLRTGHVIVLSGHVNAELSEELRAAGVSGALSKDVGLVELSNVIRSVLAGEITFRLPDRRAANLMMQEEFGLSKREMEILEYIAEGERNTEIGYRLGISEATVRVHVHNIFKKLRVNSRIEAYNCVKFFEARSP